MCGKKAILYWRILKLYDSVNILIIREKMTNRFELLLI